jgi:hypothetical protein
LAGRSGRARPNSAAGPRSSNVSAGDSAKLGWTISILAILACALASSYSGSAIARVKNEFYTNADGYADLAHATGGPAFGLFARFFITTTPAAAVRCCQG